MIELILQYGTYRVYEVSSDHNIVAGAKNQSDLFIQCIRNAQEDGWWGFLQIVPYEDRYLMLFERK